MKKKYGNPEEQTIDIVKEILLKHANQQVNLTSEAAREIIAKEIQKALFVSLDVDY